jgi:hypothetical protein
MIWVYILLTAFQKYLEWAFFGCSRDRVMDICQIAANQSALLCSLKVDNGKTNFKLELESLEIENLGLNQNFKIILQGRIDNVAPLYCAFQSYADGQIVLDMGQGKTAERYRADWTAFDAFEHQQEDLSFWRYRIECHSVLNRMAHPERSDVFTHQKLHQLMSTLLKRNHISQFKLDFEDCEHTFELQYQRSDLDVLNDLMVQYGLVYYFDFNSSLQTLIITDKVSNAGSHKVLLDEKHGLQHQGKAIYNLVSKGKPIKSTISSISIRTEENSEHNCLQQQAQAGNYVDGLADDFYAVNASINDGDLQKFTRVFQGQQAWQSNYIAFSASIFQLYPGDVIAVGDEGESNSKYRVIQINKYYEEAGHHQSMSTEQFKNYQHCIAIPLDTDFYPLHPANCYQHDILPSFELKALPLLAGVVCSDYDAQGRLKVALGIQPEMPTLPLRVIQKYTGVKQDEVYGLSFPLTIGTKVMVSALNHCTQQLIIVGAVNDESQQDVCRDKNQEEHNVFSENHTGFSLNAINKSIEIKNGEHQSLTILGSHSNFDETVKFSTEAGGMYSYCQDAFTLTSSQSMELKSAAMQLTSKGKQQISSQEFDVISAKFYRVKASKIAFKSVTFNLHQTKQAAFISRGTNYYHADKKFAFSAAQIVKVTAEKGVQLIADDYLEIIDASTILSFDSKGTIFSENEIQVTGGTIEKKRQAGVNSGGDSSAQITKQQQSVFEDLLQ